MVRSRPKKLISTRKSAFDTGLVAWEKTRSCVLQNGDIVVHGKYTAESDPLINIFRGSKLRCAITPHEYTELQPLIIQGTEYVAISGENTDGFCEIYLLHPQTLKITSAYKARNLMPGKMCVGEPGTLYVEHLVKGRPVVKLDITDKKNKDTGHRVNSQMEAIFDLHYTSFGAKKMLIFTRWKFNTIQAVNAESGTLLWKVQGEVVGKLCNPHGITSTKEGHVVIADGTNCRLFMLDARNGELINTHDLKECGVAIQPHMTNNDKELILWYRYQGKEHLGYYNIN